MSAGREFVGPYRMFHLIRAGAMFEIWAVRPMAETTISRMTRYWTFSRFHSTPRALIVSSPSSSLCT